MPFTVTNVAPSVTPRVSIAFSGQIVLKPGPNDTCLIGVNKFDRNHIFQVLLVMSNPPLPPDPPPDPPPGPIVVNKAYHPATVVPIFSGPLFAPFSIRLQPDPFPDGGDFRVFARDPFNRTPNNHDLDYRWAINFKDLHLNLTTNHGVEPFGTLKTGVLYTARRTDPGLHPKLTRETPPADFPLYRIASNLAASITLPTEQSTVVFEWEDEGIPQKPLVLPRSGDDPRTLYTLYFINEPPNLNASPHDEFDLYYKVLPIGGVPIPGEQRFELETDSIGRSDEIPCMPVLINP